MTQYNTLFNNKVNNKLNELNKKFTTSEGSGMMLTNNEIKDIKVIMSLGTTKKNSSQEGRFLNFLRSLMTVGLPLMKNVLTPLAKSVSIPPGLTAAASATDAAIQKKIFASGITLVISNEEIDDIKEKIKSLAGAGFLIKGVSETVEHEVKEQKG